MNKNWTEIHSKIFTEICDSLNKNNIRYFILRNYKELPKENLSKDIDIVVDPKMIDLSRKIIKIVYKKNNIEYHYESKFFQVYCNYGIDLKNKISIHIDLISSYVSKGYEIFTFDELYKYVIPYKNFFALNDYFEGVMVFIYKQFNYKPKLKKEYKEIIYNTNKHYKDFSILLEELIGKQLSDKILDKINDKNFDEMLKYSPELTKQLKKYVLKKRPLTTIYKIVYFIF